MTASISSRVAALRKELARQGLDGFLVPRSDEYQNEYVPPSAERLAWVSGFTGSAGMAAVLADRAALFVDGRYILQAPDETDAAVFEVVKAPPAQPSVWLSEKVSRGSRIGFDPWLHSQNWAEAARKVLGKAGIELVAVAKNPLDAVWVDRPLPPVAPIVVHPLEFAGEAAEAKRVKLAEGLKKQNIGAFIVTAPDSIAWLLNVRGNDVPHTPFALSFVILHANGEVDWFVEERKLSDAVRSHIGNSVRVRAHCDFALEISKLAKVGVVLAADPGETGAAVFEAMGLSAQRLTDPCQLPKATKNEVEVAGTTAAHARDGVALVKFFAWLDAQKPGTIDELTVMSTLRKLRSEGQHFRDLSFESISGAGPNGAIVHYRASEKTNRKLGAGELLLLDSGGQYLDGTTDVTRTVAIGVPSAEMIDRFTRVLQGHIDLASAVFPPNTTGAQLDGFARRALWEAGLDFDHRTGHGVGSYLSVHEGPQYIGGRDTQVMLPGMVVSNEPGYYKAGAYGIRIESLVVVEKRSVPGGEREMLGLRTLTMCPIDRRLIDVKMLSEAQKVWLNGYHAEVLRVVGPAVSGEAKVWLEKNTAPL